MTVIARFIDRVERTPDAPALRSIPDRRTWSYRALLDEVEACAGGLDRHGVGAGDRVSALMGQTWESIVLHLAAMRVGAVLHPVSPTATAAEVRGVVDDVDPSLVVVPGDGAGDGEVVRRWARSVPVGDLLGNEPVRAALPDLDDLACILHTSGTTGRPKGSMTTHRSLLANATALVDAWGITDADTLLHLLPLHHVHGLFVAVHPVLVAGGTVLFGGRFRVETVVEHIPGATILMGVPTFYTRLLGEPRVDADLVRHMRLFTSGSAPLLDGTHRDWRVRTGHDIVERYGMTEILMALSNPLEGERRPGTVGLALPGVSVRVRTEGGLLGDDGDVGVLEVRGPTVSPGYWRRPGATEAARTEDGWFVTGDLVVREADGYHRIVGRTSDMVISGGLNVYPKEVEDVIDRVEGVRESAVIGVPHPDLGEAVVAVCVGDGDGEVLLAACRERLSAHKVPKAVAWLPELPRNTMGKVQKAMLRELFGRSFDP